MKLRAVALAAVVGFITIPVLADVPARDDAKMTPFVSAVMAHWEKWDTDADGLLASSELDAAVADPSNTGDAAAAAASLRMLTRGSRASSAPELTKAYFETYNARAIKTIARETAENAIDATVDPNTERDDNASDRTAASRSERGSQPNWDRYFLAGKARIARGGSGKAWPDTFSLQSMKQGPLGDCFFIATVGSMTIRSPERLHEIIKPLDNGDYLVTFPNAESFTIKPVTEANRAMSSTTTDQGAWMAVLEQAYGKHRSRLRGGSLDVDGTNILRTGGDSGVTIRAITGNTTQRISFPKTLEERDEKADEYLGKLRTALKENIAAGRLITCGVLTSSAASPGRTPPKVKSSDGREGTLPVMPRGLLRNHVYAIVDFDEATDTVELWNPHSNTFTPQGTPGLVNGYPTKGGQFKVPLREAYRFYGSFTFETAEPVKKD